jgi:alcohol dehydrogenase
MMPTVRFSTRVSPKVAIKTKAVRHRRNRGVDTAIEAVGIPATFELCEGIVAPGGRA